MRHVLYNNSFVSIFGWTGILKVGIDYEGATIKSRMYKGYCI